MFSRFGRVEGHESTDSASEEDAGAQTGGVVIEAGVQPERQSSHPPLGTGAQQVQGFAKFLKETIAPADAGYVTCGGRVIPVGPNHPPPTFHMDFIDRILQAGGIENVAALAQGGNQSSSTNPIKMEVSPMVSGAQLATEPFPEYVEPPAMTSRAQQQAPQMSGGFQQVQGGAQALPMPVVPYPPDTAILSLSPDGYILVEMQTIAGPTRFRSRFECGSLILELFPLHQPEHAQRQAFLNLEAWLQYEEDRLQGHPCPRGSPECLQRYLQRTRQPFLLGLTEFPGQPLRFVYQPRVGPTPPTGSSTCFCRRNKALAAQAKKRTPILNLNQSASTTGMSLANMKADVQMLEQALDKLNKEWAIAGKDDNGPAATEYRNRRGYLVNRKAQLRRAINGATGALGATGPLNTQNARARHMPNLNPALVLPLSQEEHARRNAGRSGAQNTSNDYALAVAMQGQYYKEEPDREPQPPLSAYARSFVPGFIESSRHSSSRHIPSSGSVQSSTRRDRQTSGIDGDQPHASHGKGPAKRPRHKRSNTNDTWNSEIEASMAENEEIKKFMEHHARNRASLLGSSYASSSQYASSYSVATPVSYAGSRPSSYAGPNGQSLQATRSSGRQLQRRAGNLSHASSPLNTMSTANHAAEADTNGKGKARAIDDDEANAFRQWQFPGAQTREPGMTQNRSNGVKKENDPPLQDGLSNTPRRRGHVATPSVESRSMSISMPRPRLPIVLRLRPAALAQFPSSTGDSSPAYRPPIMGHDQNGYATLVAGPSQNGHGSVATSLSQNGYGSPITGPSQNVYAFPYAGSSQNGYGPPISGPSHNGYSPQNARSSYRGNGFPATPQHRNSGQRVSDTQTPGSVRQFNVQANNVTPQTPTARRRREGREPPPFPPVMGPFPAPPPPGPQYREGYPEQQGNAMPFGTYNPTTMTTPQAAPGPVYQNGYSSFAPGQNAPLPPQRNYFGHDAFPHPPLSSSGGNAGTSQRPFYAPAAPMAPRGNAGTSQLPPPPFAAPYGNAGTSQLPPHPSVAPYGNAGTSQLPMHASVPGGNTGTSQLPMHASVPGGNTGTSQLPPHAPVASGPHPFPVQHPSTWMTSHSPSAQAPQNVHFGMSGHSQNENFSPHHGHNQSPWGPAPAHSVPVLRSNVGGMGYGYSPAPIGHNSSAPLPNPGVGPARGPVLTNMLEPNAVAPNAFGTQTRPSGYRNRPRVNGSNPFEVPSSFGEEEKDPWFRHVDRGQYR